MVWLPGRTLWFEAKSAQAQWLLVTFQLRQCLDEQQLFDQWSAEAGFGSPGQFAGAWAVPSSSPQDLLTRFPSR